MELAQKSDAEILAVASPIMDNLMDASTAIDYDRHVQDFTPRAKSALTRESLHAICEHYQSTKGAFSKREPVAIFRRPDSIAVVWRQQFTKQPVDFVAEMVLVQDGDKYLVDYVMVI